MTKQRNRFSTAFKLEVIALVTEQGYSIRQAAESMGVGKSTLDKWVRQYRQEKQGLTPDGSKALTPEQQEIQQLKKRIKQLELEKDILKQASVLLGAGNLKKY